MRTLLPIWVHFWVSKLLIVAPPLVNQLLALVGMQLTVGSTSADTISEDIVIGIGLAWSYWTHRQATKTVPPPII
jgi:hypothetical protein